MLIWIWKVLFIYITRNSPKMCVSPVIGDYLAIGVKIQAFIIFQTLVWCVFETHLVHNIMVNESACEAVARRYSFERESEFPVTTQSAHCSALEAAGYQRCHLSPYLPSLAVNLICEDQHSYVSKPGTEPCSCLNQDLGK